MENSDSQTPAELVRAILAEHRRRGYDFEIAWKNSLRSLPRGSGQMKEFWDEWREVLRWARPHYEAGYNRWEADFTSVFVALCPEHLDHDEYVQS